MPLKFYLDHNISPDIAFGLQNQGVDVMVAIDDGYHEKTDEQVLQRATDLGCIIVTKDNDFLRLAKEWADAGQSFSGIVRVAPYVSIGRAIEQLLELCHCCTEEDLRDRVHYLQR